MERSMSVKKSSKPEVVTMSDDELSSLQSRIASGEMNAADQALMISVLETMRLLCQTVQKANTTIGTLRRWFGFKKTERNPSSQSNSSAAASEDDNSNSSGELNVNDSAGEDKKKS